MVVLYNMPWVEDSTPNNFGFVYDLTIMSYLLLMNLLIRVKIILTQINTSHFNVHVLSKLTLWKFQEIILHRIGPSQAYLILEVLMIESPKKNVNFVDHINSNNFQNFKAFMNHNLISLDLIFECLFQLIHVSLVHSKSYTYYS